MVLLDRPVDFGPSWAVIGVAVMNYSDFLQERHTDREAFKRGLEERFGDLNGAITHAVLVAVDEALDNVGHHNSMVFEDYLKDIMKPRPE